MEKILREVLSEDKNLLGRRDELINILEQRVPGNLRRDFAPIKKALSLNVGEKFFVGESDRDAAKREVEEILKSSGMQTARIDFVIDTFIKALDWDKPFVANEEPPKVVEAKKESNSFAELYRQKKEEVAQAANEPVPAKPKPAPQAQPTRLPARPNNSPQQQTAPPVTPPTPAQVSAENKNKMLIGLVCILAVALFFVLGNQTKETSAPTQSASVTSTQTEPVENTDYLNAKTDLSLDGMDLDTPMYNVEEKIGRPLRIEKVDGCDRYIYSDLFEVAVINGKVDAFVTRNPANKTLRGLHVGSTYGEVIDKYGSNSKDMDIDNLTLHEYPFNSITGRYGLLRFAVNSAGRVEYISIRIVEEPSPSPPPKQESKSNIDENVKQAAAAFVSFHQAITDGNFSAAFNLFTDERKANMDYNVRGFASGYSDTISSEITDLQLVSNSGDTVVMNYILDARDRADGRRVLYQQFSGQVVMTKVGGAWKIASTESKRIKEVMER